MKQNRDCTPVVLTIMDFASQLNFIKHINYEFNRETGVVDELNAILETDATRLASW